MAASFVASDTVASGDNASQIGFDAHPEFSLDNEDMSPAKVGRGGVALAVSVDGG